MTRIPGIAFVVVLWLAALLPAASAQGPEENDPIPGTAPQAAVVSPLRALPAQPVAPFVAATGSVSVSVDAVGTNDPAGALVDVEKPAGATVRNAYLIAASRGFSNYEPQDGDITIGGVGVNWDPSRTMTNGIQAVNVFADITSQVSGAIDAAPAGMVRFRIAEGAATSNIDGAILAVIFDDPNVVGPSTVVLAYGAQQVTGDRIQLVRPAEVPNDDVEVRLGVGISFGFQPSNQWNAVNVNGVRLSSSAGGQDDGLSQNGTLITAGGVGDVADNPVDPFALGNQASCPRCDDELYDLQPFLSDGLVSDLELTTENPSADDNFFFAALEVVGASATWTPVGERNPLVVLHGITGAFLQDGNGDEVWPDEGDTATDPDDDQLDVLALAANGIEPADPNDNISVSTDRGFDGIIGVTELCNRVFCQNLGDAYRPMFEMLDQDYGYVLGADLFPFAFDWRLSAEVNGQRLLDFIESVRSETGAVRVNIAAHSQGGLVMRAALDDPRSVGMVERVATMGTPNLGATKLHGVLDLQQPCQADTPVGGCFLARAQAQALTTNWPGALELLPSRGFFDTYTSSIRRDIDDDNDGQVEGLLPFAEVRQQLADRNLNLIDNATAFHDRVDLWDPADNQIDLLRMVGTGSDTIVRVHQFLDEECSGILWWRDCELVETFEFEMGDGDGTVPLSSAQLLGDGINLSGGAKVCNVSGPDSGHGDLPNNALVLAIMLDFLEDDDYRCEVRELANSRSSALAVSASSSPAASKVASELRATELLVRGPLTGYVERDGSGLSEVMGIVDPSLPIELEGIDGGTYTTANGSTSFSVTHDAGYSGTWTATAPGEAHFLLRSYQGPIASVLSTEPFTVEAGAVLRVRFTHPAGSATVDVDDTGDGTIDRSVALDISIEGLGASDGIAPKTIVEVRSLSDEDAGSVEVSITATDEGGSGVAFTQYALDASTESQVYTGPFTVPALGELYVRSWDRAGNVEAPYQVIVLDDHSSRPDLVDEFLVPQFNEAGLLGYPGDVDNWGMQIETAGRYKLSLIGLQADYDLRLLAADGTEIALSTKRGSKSEKITVDLAAGTYFLEVSGFDGAFSAQDDYRVIAVANG